MTDSDFVRRLLTSKNQRPLVLPDYVHRALSGRMARRGLITRRSALVGMSSAALASLYARHSFAATPFTTFAFTATGQPTARTMPDRLRDVKNVVDYGAVADGSTDDSAAIQAAINDTSAPYSSANRGIIWFPNHNTNVYQIANPLTFELSAGITAIGFVGSPGAKIRGTINDALLKRSINSPTGGVYLVQDLIFENDSTGANAAGILFNSIVGGKIVGCELSGACMIETVNSQSVTVDSCSLTAGGISGVIGILAGNATSILSCDITGMAEGIRHSNAGLAILGGRLEVNTVGVNLGVDQSGSAHGSSAVFMTGTSMESNDNGIQVPTGTSVSTSEFVGLAITCAQASKHTGVSLIGSANDVIFGGVNTSSSNASSWVTAGWNIQGAQTALVLDSCGSSLGGVGINAWSINWAGGIDVDIRNPNVGSGFTVPTYPTLAQLPSASGLKGSRRFIGDGAASPTFSGTATGSGSLFTPVYSDGTNWRNGG